MAAAITTMPPRMSPKSLWSVFMTFSKRRAGHPRSRPKPSARNDAEFRPIPGLRPELTCPVPESIEVARQRSFAWALRARMILRYREDGALAERGGAAESGNSTPPMRAVIASVLRHSWPRISTGCSAARSPSFRSPVRVASACGPDRLTAAAIVIGQLYLRLPDQTSVLIESLDRLPYCLVIADGPVRVIGQQIVQS
jgi:hypothetical protein